MSMCAGRPDREVCTHVVLASAGVITSMPQPDTPILNYASPGIDEGGWRFIRPMYRWRTACACCLCLTLASLVHPWPIGIIAGTMMTLASAAMTIIYIGRAAQNEVGTAYAVRHILLA